MAAVQTFAIALDKEYEFDHTQIADILDFFGGGLRQVKNVTIRHSQQGLCFPVAIFLSSCVCVQEAGQKVVKFNGHLHNGDHTFYFFATARKHDKTAQVIFSEKKPEEPT